MIFRFLQETGMARALICGLAARLLAQLLVEQRQPRPSTSICVGGARQASRGKTSVQSWFCNTACDAGEVANHKHKTIPSLGFRVRTTVSISTGSQATKISLLHLVERSWAYYLNHGWYRLGLRSAPYLVGFHTITLQCTTTHPLYAQIFAKESSNIFVPTPAMIK